MLRETVVIEAVCEKCGAVWVPRVREDGKLPAVCPECKSRNWNEEGAKNIAPPAEKKLVSRPQVKHIAEKPPMPDIESAEDEVWGGAEDDVYSELVDEGLDEEEELVEEVRVVYDKDEEPEEDGWGT